MGPVFVKRGSSDSIYFIVSVIATSSSGGLELPAVWRVKFAVSVVNLY
jgi:hypothetical protein